MIQTLGISIIVALIGYFILDIFVDGVLQDPFAKTVVYGHAGDRSDSSVQADFLAE